MERSTRNQMHAWWCFWPPKKPQATSAPQGRHLRAGGVHRVFLRGLVLGCIETKFARKYAFDSIFLALQGLHTCAPLQTQHVSKKSVLKISDFGKKSPNFGCRHLRCWHPSGFSFTVVCRRWEGISFSSLSSIYLLAIQHKVFRQQLRPSV